MDPTWEQAWHAALYGPEGFYRRPEGPAGHFATSAQGAAAELFAGALLELARREGLTTVVDVACGRGELLSALAAQADPSIRLVGVDVVPRPDDLPSRVEWVVSPGGADLPDLGSPTAALILAHEWLDVVPCPIAEVDDEGVLRVVHVAPDGSESLGDPLAGPDRDWCDRWWPGPGSPGDRVEVGRARDVAFEDLVRRTGSGLVVAVDYGHVLGDRPPAGSLVGFVDGSVCTPVPDGGCDLTAHVAMDSLRPDRLLTQREALRELGVDGARPPLDLARSDPAGYLAALSRASQAAALTSGGPGGFLWALRRVG